MSVGQKLQELLKANNMKKIELAKQLGISPERLSNYLQDKREPDIQTLAKIAQRLCVDLNYFADI